MKKLLWILVLGLLWCNVGVANILLNKCLELNSDGSYVQLKKDGSYTKEYEGSTNEYFINFEKGYVIYTYVKSDLEWKEAQWIYEQAIKNSVPEWPQPKRTTNIYYMITFSDEKIITAKSDVGTGTSETDQIQEGTYKELYIKLDKNIVEINTIGVTEQAKRFIIRMKKMVKDWSLYPNHITHCKRGDLGGTSSDQTSGTAFFINNRGNLITNNHVVEGCEISKINYFNKEYDTNLIATDKTLDLALLKAELIPKSYIAFSSDEPKKRDLIIIAGYPLGKYLSDDLKINQGNISSLKGFENNSNEITVDLAINPGNSGGPIVNENGQLVAVAVAGMSKEITEGISFGIKSSAVTNFLKSNKIRPDFKLTSFSMNKDKVNQLLEESTVYIFCEQ